MAPCPTGWRLAPNLTIEIGKLAVNTCAFPLYEVENGKYKITRKPGKKKPVMDYIRLQGRFRHLPESEVEQIQKDIDREWDLLLKKEKFTNEE
jgi:pyruvate/2-oxoacid:ferredoxin oxidoreductase beta subunit